MKKVLYFAYGSNMLFNRLDLRLRHLGKIVKVGTRKLYGWKLLFNVESEHTCNNFANIVPALPTEFVEGVLYKITAEQLRTLDVCEGLYYRYHFDIDADTIAIAYICTKEELLGQHFNPDRYYLDYCIQGALENNLYHTSAYLMDLKPKIDITRRSRPQNFKNY